MNNPVAWFEIYVADMARAKEFYEAGCAAIVVLEKASPGLGKAQQAERVAGWRGIEDHVSIG